MFVRCVEMMKPSLNNKGSFVVFLTEGSRLANTLEGGIYLHISFNLLLLFFVFTFFFCNPNFIVQAELL